MKFSAVILAAGKGTRMHSNMPKVLHFGRGSQWLNMLSILVLALAHKTFT